MRIHSLILPVLVGCTAETKPSDAHPVDPSLETTTPGPTTGGTTDEPTTGGTDPTDSSVETGEAPDPRLALLMGEPNTGLTDHFASPDVCAQCHSNVRTSTAMRTADGTGVAPYDLQHASMMANAGRDPLFWAVLSAESAGAPELVAEIEDTCLRCHAPMGRTEAEMSGLDFPAAADLRLGDTRVARLSLDGVSCTTCHRLDPANLGAPETWSGHYQISSTSYIYGPHEAPLTGPMQAHTGFTPREGLHMMTSEVCASCHTLQTPTLVDGAPSAFTFLEQAPYLEWRNSAYAPDGSRSAACQQCHMPTTDSDGTPIETRIARNPGGGDFTIDPRQPFGQHFQVGGNTFMLGILRDNADILNPRANADAFNATIARARTMLATAASVEVTDVVRTGDQLSAVVVVHNQTGHKLPTGYPSRRAWLQVQVTDATGAVVFQSGQTDTRGRLVDHLGAVLPSEEAGGPVQPHRDILRASTDVQIYQSLMANPAGDPVFRLLNAAAMAKDNRILPLGWRPETTVTEVGDIAPVGTASDPNFVEGADTVSLSLASLGGTAPYSLDVRLVYQAVSPRYVDELALVDTPEVAAFLAMAETADWTPETIAATAVVVE